MIERDHKLTGEANNLANGGIFINLENSKWTVLLMAEDFPDESKLKLLSKLIFLSIRLKFVISLARLLASLRNKKIYFMKEQQSLTPSSI